MGSFSVGVNELEKLVSIESKIDELLASQSPSGLDFNLLTLNPTYQSNSSNGWNIAPANLPTIYDGDASTASNLFEPVGGIPWVYGEIELFPGISIPQFTRINLKVGIRNNNNNRSLFELAAFNIALSGYINVWSYFGNLSATQDTIVTIDVILPYQWDKLRFRIQDTTSWTPQARIYDLKVYEVA